MDEPLLVSSRRHEMSRLPHLCGRARGLLRAPSGGPEQTWAWEGFGNKRHLGCDPKAELGRRVFQTHLSFIIVCWSLSVFKGLLELDWPDLFSKLPEETGTDASFLSLCDKGCLTHTLHSRTA